MGRSHGWFLGGQLRDGVDRGCRLEVDFGRQKAGSWSYCISMRTVLLGGVAVDKVEPSIKKLPMGLGQWIPG